MFYETLAPTLVFLIVVISLWSSVWKAIALWKSARNNQLAWFVVLIIFNTAGILEILYIFLFQKKGRVFVKKGSK